MRAIGDAQSITLIEVSLPAIISLMSKVEILEELVKLTHAERNEIRLRLAELDGDSWLDDKEPLTNAEKAILEARLAAYEKDPEAGSSWAEVEARIRARLSP